MNKGVVLSFCAVVALSSCGTYTGAGAYAGAGIGSVLGSAIGGISGGPRGSDVGTIVGMASGALVGAAVGSAADKAEQEKYESYQRRVNASYTRGGQEDEGSGYDPDNGGDDRIELDNGSGSGSSYTSLVATTLTPQTIVPTDLTEAQLAELMPGYNFNYNPQIEVSNIVFSDTDGDGNICAGETCKVSFDIINASSTTIYAVVPTVFEASGNSRIYISQSINIESIEAGKGLKYIATVSGDEKLKDGNALIRLAVVQGSNDVTSSIYEFNIPTKRD